MRRRIVSLLLVPLVLANHALCLAHSHDGTGIAQPDAHGERPHFHCSHTHGHRHNHREHHAGDAHGHLCAHHERAEINLPPAVTALDDHDADALYCDNASVLAAPRSLSQVIAAQYSPAAAVPGDAALGDDGVPRAGPLRAETCQLFETGCPIYLRTLSLRI